MQARRFGGTETVRLAEMPRAYDPEVEGQYQAFVSSGSLRRCWHLNKLRLFELAGISRDDLVLDAGCGAGNLVSELAPRCRTVVGCDYHHGRLAFAAGRLQGEFVEASIDRLPFADGLFDKIFCLEVIEHIEHSVNLQILREFFRVLKPDGQLILTTPNYRSAWPAIEFLMNTLRLVPEMPGGAHISKYHWRSLEDSLTDAGFVITRMGTFNHLSPFIAPVSTWWAERMYRWELKAGRRRGNLLYALCRKRQPGPGRR
jgi:2-polyprenyl-3-methyl-5-hydroxy-6-metoxy-1,4-benzoquinol methylase